MRNHQISDAERIPQIWCSSCIDQPTVNFSKITALQWNRWKWPSPLSNSRNCNNNLSWNNAPVQRFSEKNHLAKRCLLCSLGRVSRTKPCRPCVGPWDCRPQVAARRESETWQLHLVQSTGKPQCCWIEVPSLCPPCTSLMSSLGTRKLARPNGLNAERINIVSSSSSRCSRPCRVAFVRSLVVVVVVAVVVVVVIIVYSCRKVVSGVLHKSTSILTKLYGPMLSVQATKINKISKTLSLDFGTPFE